MGYNGRKEIGIYTAEDGLITENCKAKFEAGASFAITQLGYDADKYEELPKFKKANLCGEYLA